jgi:hypothetical protein
MGIGTFGLWRTNDPFVIEIESQSTRLREPKLITVLVVNVGQGPLLLPWTNQRNILVWPNAL